MRWYPHLVHSTTEPNVVSLGHPDVDDYLRFVADRARPNTLSATAYDLKVRPHLRRPFGDLSGWQRALLVEQLAAEPGCGRFAA